MPEPSHNRKSAHGARPADLPDFTSPPLAEVVVGIQFNPPSGLTAAHFGLLWSSFRADYPLVEQRPPLRHVVEFFGDDRAMIAPGISVEFMEGVPMPRHWFVSDDGSQLIQVQQDRFIHNWRKTDGAMPYPRYNHVRERFRQELGVFQTFLETEELGELIVDQAEVTYVNHMVAGARWAQISEASQVLSSFGDGLAAAEPAVLEGVELTSQYLIQDSNHRDIGRLHVTTRSARRRSDNSPMFVLELTARGAPNSERIPDILEFIDSGHNAIVRTFAALTTPAMHAEWGRTQ